MAQKLMNLTHYLVQISAYYCVWVSCIFFASIEKALIGTLISTVIIFLQLLWQFYIRNSGHGLWYLIIILTTIGSLTDSIFIWSHYIIFLSNPFSPYFTPPWMIVIWISFSILVFSTLTSLFNHYFLLGLLSFFGFTIAYALGGKMGAALFPHGYLTCLLIGTVWALLLPLCLFFYQRILI